MSELSDYKRLVEKPMVESLEATIRNLRAELDRTNGDLRCELERASCCGCQADKHGSFHLLNSGAARLAHPLASQPD